MAFLQRSSFENFGFWQTSSGQQYQAGQCLNPAFVHALAVPDVDMLDKSGKICVVARGDGIVDIITIESELAAIRSNVSSKSGRKSQGKSKDSGSNSVTENLDQNGRNLHLDYSCGGHTAAVSCVCQAIKHLTKLSSDV